MCLWLQEMEISKELPGFHSHILNWWSDDVNLLFSFLRASGQWTKARHLFKSYDITAQYLSDITLLHNPNFSFHLYLIPACYRWNFGNCDLQSVRVPHHQLTHAVSVASASLRIYFLWLLSLPVVLVWVPPKLELKARFWVQGNLFWRIFQEA